MTIAHNAIKAALAEIAVPTQADTAQFFGPHPLEMDRGCPRVYAVILSNDVYEVYFRPEAEHYFLVMLVDHHSEKWSIRGCRAAARARVALSIVSDELTADDITQAIRLEPTESWSKGDPRPQSTQSLKPYTFTRWTFCPEGDLPGEFEDKLTRLLDLTDDASPRIRVLGASCDVNVLVGYQGYTHQMWGLPVDARNMVRIAAMEAGLDVDLYASGPELGHPHKSSGE